MSDRQEDWSTPVAPEPDDIPQGHIRVFSFNTSRGRGRVGGTGQSNETNWRARRGNDDQERYSFRQSSGNKKIISIPTHKVGRVIGKHGSKIREIEYDSEAKIKIGDSNGYDTDVTIFGAVGAITMAERLIIELLKERRAPPPRDNYDNANTSRNDASAKASWASYPMFNQVLDWDRRDADYDINQQEKWSKLTPIKKDFYVEDPNVIEMSAADVKLWRFANHDIQVKRIFDDKTTLRSIPNPVLSFEQAFQRYPEILDEIYKQDFKQPSPIQSQAWPILLKGEDMIGIAQTGTGKTLAFLLPALIHIDGQPTPKEQRAGATVLIMAPTRELVLQIAKEVSKYQYRGIKSVCVYGGVDKEKQIQHIADGVDIVIATPGRFNDLVMIKHLNAINFSYIVLDEADRMLDMGFQPQIKTALSDVRPDRQTIMTSATWPNAVRHLAETYMKDPIQVTIGSLDLAAVHTVTQNIMFVEEDEKEVILLNFINAMLDTDKIIIFCGKKVTASHIATELSMKGIGCRALHGDRDQLDREAAIKDMVDGIVNILVATDVASRGIDIKDLTHVINFDFPHHIEEYIHRVGRTGRAGKTGTALSFITKTDWALARDLIKILEEAHQSVPDELLSMAKRFEDMKLRRGRGGSVQKSFE